MKLAWVLTLLVLIAGCQRATRTETRYLPPQSPEKQACVERCYQTDRDCLGSSTVEPRPLGAPVKSEPVADAEQLADAEQAKRDYDECSKRVQAEFENCQTGARTSNRRGTCYRPVCVVQPGALPVSGSTPSAPTSNDEQACARIFRGCFERCGGKIETREVCEGAC